MYAILASMALMAVSAVASPGSAIVVNSCSYNVYMANTPSADGVHTEIDETLKPGATYTQTWTELTNGAGWSIKLSQAAGAFSSNILQYEYTYHDDGIIWYDLSEVNGNPWNANWEITASSPGGTCTPLQQAYRYATDDAYGMQACPDDSTITVTLCSGDSDNDAAASSASVSAAAVSSAATASSSGSSASVKATTFATSTVLSSSVVTTNTKGSTITSVGSTAITATITSVATSSVSTTSTASITSVTSSAVSTSSTATSTHYTHGGHSARHAAARRNARA